MRSPCRHSLFLIFSLLCLPLSAQSLEQDLATADALAATGDWAGAHKTLKQAMESASDHSEVLRKLPELQQRLADWTFEQQAGNISANDLFQGEVKSFKEKSLAVKIVWDWESMSDEEKNADFIRMGNDWFFNSQLSGKIKFTVNGEFTGKKPVTLLGGFNMASSSGWVFTPGFINPESNQVVSMSCRRVGNQPERLGLSADKVDVYGGEWSYTLELNRGAFTLKRGRKKAGKWKTKYPELIEGFYGFSAEGVKSIEISASLNPEHWTKKEAELQRAMRDRFARGEYKAEADYPSWLITLEQKSKLAKPLRAPNGAGGGWDKLTSPSSDIDIEDFIRNRDLTPEIADYARALHAYGNGNLSDCDKFCRQAVAKGLDFGPLWDLYARARFGTSGRTKPLEMLREHLKDWPDDCGRTLAWLSGRRAGPTSALSAYKEALAAGGVSGDIIKGMNALETALAGPLGRDLSTRWVGKNVIVLSDSGKGSAEVIGQWADNFLTYLGRDFLEFQKPKGQIQLLHFSDQASLKAFQKRLNRNESPFAINTTHIPMVAWDSREATPPRDLYSTLFFHYVASSVEVSKIPRWAYYGMKSWFESGQMEGPSYVGIKNKAAYDRTSENEAGLFFTPQQLILLPASVWATDETARYWAEAESAILMQFLIMTKEPAFQGLFRRYLSAVAGGRNAGSAFSAALRTTDMGKMAESFKSFWEENK